MDCANTPKLRFRAEDLDLSERKKYLSIPVVERRRKMHRCALVAKQ